MDRLRFAFLLTLMWSAAILAAVVAVFMSITGPANAQQVVCGNLETMKAKLAEKYGEVATSAGMVNENGILMLFQSPDGGTWTLLGVKADGTACVISDGEAWGEIRKSPVLGKRPA